MKTENGSYDNSTLDVKDRRKGVRWYKPKDYKKLSSEENNDLRLKRDAEIDETDAQGGKDGKKKRVEKDKNKKLSDIMPVVKELAAKVTSQPSAGNA